AAKRTSFSSSQSVGLSPVVPATTTPSEPWSTRWVASSRNLSTLTEPSASNGVRIAVRTSPSTCRMLRQLIGELADGEEDRLREGRVGLDRVDEDVDRRLGPYGERELPEPLGRLRADRDRAGEHTPLAIREKAHEAVPLRPLVRREARRGGQLP